MRCWTALLLALMTGACSTSPVRIQSAALADQVSKSPERFIIAAVDNEPAGFVARAGSTPRAYDGVQNYGPSQAARQRMRSLENEYGLHEVSAWPIAPLSGLARCARHPIRYRPVPIVRQLATFRLPTISVVARDGSFSTKLESLESLVIHC